MDQSQGGGVVQLEYVESPMVPQNPRAEPPPGRETVCFANVNTLSRFLSRRLSYGRMDPELNLLYIT